MTWGGYCLWQQDRTQFAVWNQEQARSEGFYEVVRTGTKFYFRSLPESDWPLIDHGRLVRCALWFAEPPAERERFYREHAQVLSGGVTLIDLPPKAPQLASGPQRPAELGSKAAPATLTPGPGDEILVPPWEAVRPRDR